MDETPAHTTSRKTMNLRDETKPKRDIWKGVPLELCVRRIPLIRRAVPVWKQPYQINKNHAIQVKNEISQIAVGNKLGDMESPRERLCNLKKLDERRLQAQWAT